MPRAACEESQKLEFQRCSRHGPSAASKLAAKQIELAVTESRADCGFRFRCAAAKQRTYPRAQLFRAIGLGHVIVGTDIEAEHFLGLAGACGQQQDLRAHSRAPQRAA